MSKNELLELGLKPSDHFVKTQLALAMSHGVTLTLCKDDYINLSEAVRDFPNLYEIPIHSDKDYRETLEKLHLQLESIPLFVKTTDNNIYVLSEFETKKLPTKDTVLVYVGQEI